MRLTPAIIAATHQLFLRFTRVYKYTGYIIKLNPKVRFDILVKWYIGGGGGKFRDFSKNFTFFCKFLCEALRKPLFKFPFAQISRFGLKREIKALGNLTRASIKSLRQRY